MRKIILSIALIFVFSFFIKLQAQTLITVNNNPGAPTGTNVFTNFADALTAAVTGDIIYMVPSSISYGTLNITKGVTIFGAGLEPDKNIGTKTAVGGVRIDASNVRISGLVSSSEWHYGYNINTGTLSNITIENSRFGSFRIWNSGVQLGNLLLRNNVISQSSAYSIILGTTSNVIITNNLILLYQTVVYAMQANGATFSHNIFRAAGINGTDGLTINTVSNCQFEYNIFYGSTTVVTNGGNNNFDYNLSFGISNNSFSSIGSNGNTGTGNVENGDPVFVNLPLGTDWNGSYDLSIDTGSAADDIDGSAGIAGVTGGATPWDPDGSLLPTVQTINIPSVVPVGEDLDVNVTGKGN